MEKKEKIDLTIKPTMGCNMKCQHCFNGNVYVPQEMLDVNTALAFVEKACKEYRNVKVVFHGGEPSLAGIDFYRDYFKKIRVYQEQYGTVFNTLFTTNGILLTNDFIDLLNDNNVLINVSFDGPYNNLLRQQTKRVEEIVFNIRDKGGRYRCFCTISKDSVQHLKEIYDYFTYNHINFKTLPIEKRGYAKNNDDIIMSPKDLVDQFENVYRFWITDKGCKISYSTFEEFANLRRTVQHRKFWFGRKIALNPNGQLYVFGRPNDINYKIGNLFEFEKLSDCFKSEGYIKYLKTLENIRNSRCGKCESNGVCGGVNINIAYLYVDDLELIDYSCMQSNMLFQRILSVNDDIIADFLEGNTAKYNVFIQKVFNCYLNGSEKTII